MNDKSNDMKKILLLFLSISVLTSCLGDSSWSESYVLTSTFEYTDLEMGPDSVWVNTTSQVGHQWRDMLFCHKLDEVKNFTGGFILSALKGNLDMVEPDADEPTVVTADELVNPYRVYGKYSAADNNYLVFLQDADDSRMPVSDMCFLLREYGSCVVRSCLVNNTEYVARSVKETFEDGDKLTLIAKAYLDGEPTGKEASINLAEFSQAKDSVVCSWTTFDLSKLGEADVVNFELVSDKEIPMYFCMDYVVSNISVAY